MRKQCDFHVPRQRGWKPLCSCMSARVDIAARRVDVPSTRSLLLVVAILLPASLHTLGQKSDTLLAARRSFHYTSAAHASRTPRADARQTKARGKIVVKGLCSYDGLPPRHANEQF
eukprot:TRINITY_DN7054_c0_g1_i10.p1 TRINITY_DN7054_c0_g1~~TRINITY_DN7054_c0_g1_i10.p1  ORF type:complete len:116 (+),score=3.21 TRINITY_DN7054_c0_g1_i10:140-487(+)